MRHIYGTLFNNTGQPIFTIVKKTNYRMQMNSDTKSAIVRLFSCPSVLIFVLGTQKMRRFRFDYPQHMPW